MKDERPTRGERREQRRRKRRKMGVSGGSVRRLQEIILKKRDAVRRKAK